MENLRKRDQADVRVAQELFILFWDERTHPSHNLWKIEAADGNHTRTESPFESRSRSKYAQVVSKPVQRHRVSTEASCWFNVGMSVADHRHHSPQSDQYLVLLQGRDRRIKIRHGRFELRLGDGVERGVVRGGEFLGEKFQILPPLVFSEREATRFGWL